MHSRKSILFWGVLVCLSLVFSSCRPSVLPEVTSVSPTAAATAIPGTPTPVPTATTPPSRSLVVCLGQEPLTLYPYGGSSRAMWSVLEAIYDGPIDTVNFNPKPVILEKIPTLAGGDAVISQVDVKPGDTVIDASGNPVILAAGVPVLPAGCTGPDCASKYDGSSTIKMDQMSITYKLLKGLKWSDGTALTSADSVYSYHLSDDPATPVSRKMIIRTAAYTAADAQTVMWVGRPGYVPQRLESFFWMPLPEHLWKDISADNLLTASASSRAPVGWGPYVIKDWVPGDHIELVKNPNYFRASEGLPKFESLVYRFLGEPADNNIAALMAKECDIVDQTSLLDEQLETVLDLQKAGKLKAAIGQGPEWEQLAIGIRPATYDDGYNYTSDRVDYFSDVRVRQAIAYCSDRKGIIDSVFFGQTSIPNGLVPPSSPLYAKDIAVIPYNPTEGSRLLDEVGWKNTDGNPKSPRKSLGVPYVPDGTSLVLNYATTQAPVRVKTAEKLAASLSQCGIQLNVQYLDLGDLYASGPKGILFGRNFDLAQFSWDSGVQPPCGLFETSQIPNASNNWLTVNVTGYSSTAFDAACKALRMTGPGEQNQLGKRSATVQTLFAQDLPAIPLYFRPKVAISRPDLCGLTMDVSARSDLSNLESLDYGPNCK